MKSIGTIIAAVLIVVLVVLLLGGAGMMGFGGFGMMGRGMMNGYNGYGFNPLGMVVSLVVWALVIGGIVLLIVWLARTANATTVVSGNAAIEIAKARYARGEVTKEQFDEMKKVLEV